MNEEIEAEMTEMDSIPDHLSDSEYEGAAEAVPIHIKKERKTKAYKETMAKLLITLTLMKLENKS